MPLVTETKRERGLPCSVFAVGSDDGVPFRDLLFGLGEIEPLSGRLRRIKRPLPQTSKLGSESDDAGSYRGRNEEYSIDQNRRARF